MSRSKVRGELFRVHRTNGSITAYGQYSVKSLPQFSYIKMDDLSKAVYVGNPKKEPYFGFVCIVEYIILLILMVFLNTYTNVITMISSLYKLLGLRINSRVN